MNKDGVWCCRRNHKLSPNLPEIDGMNWTMNYPKFGSLSPHSCYLCLPHDFMCSIPSSVAAVQLPHSALRSSRSCTLSVPKREFCFRPVLGLWFGQWVNQAAAKLQTNWPNSSMYHVSYLFNSPRDATDPTQNQIPIHQQISANMWKLTQATKSFHQSLSMHHGQPKSHFISTCPELEVLWSPFFGKTHQYCASIPLLSDSIYLSHHWLILIPQFDWWCPLLPGFHGEQLQIEAPKSLSFRKPQRFSAPKSREINKSWMAKSHGFPWVFWFPSIEISHWLNARCVPCPPGGLSSMTTPETPRRSNFFTVKAKISAPWRWRGLKQG